VSYFRIKTDSLMEELPKYTLANQADLVFQFQAFMLEEIDRAKMRVADECGFHFTGTKAAIQVGHIAHMTNKLKNVLFEIRTIVLGYQKQHGVSKLRKCPHCGEIWTKVIGCNGETTCGNLVKGLDSRYDKFSTFTFHFDEEEEVQRIYQRFG